MSSPDPWTHQPLPYKVRLRIVEDQDKPSRIAEHRVTAYSLSEALMQAMYAETGQFLDDDDKRSIRIESIEPDLQLYLRQLVAELVKK